MSYIIQTKDRNNDFKTIRRFVRNPVQDMTEEEIEDALLDEFGNGWYQIFRIEVRRIRGRKIPLRTTIFKGEV